MTKNTVHIKQRDQSNQQAPEYIYYFVQDLGVFCGEDWCAIHEQQDEFGYDDANSDEPHFARQAC